MSDRSTDRLELCTDRCVILFIRNAKRKPVGAMGKISGVAESVILVRLFKKKELHAELRNTERPGRPWTSFPGEEKVHHSSRPDQEQLPGGRRICVDVNNQEKTSPV